MVTNVSIVLSDDERKALSGTGRPITRKELTDLVLGFIRLRLDNFRIADAHYSNNVPDAAPARPVVRGADEGRAPDKVTPMDGGYVLHTYGDTHILYRLVERPGPDRYIDAFESEAAAKKWVAEGRS